MAAISAALIGAAVLHLAVLALVVVRGAPVRRRTSSLAEVLLVMLVGWAAGVVVADRVASLHVASLACGLSLLVVLGYVVARRSELFPASAAVWASLLVATGISVVWGVDFLVTLPVSALTRGFLWAGVLLVAVGLPASLVTQREPFEVLLRHRWRRQHTPLVELGSNVPFVSVQVPCHAEPPSLVIETLEHLARVDYPAFEVVVIDNNTTDEQLWRPVEEHCQRLGSRFRFLHVEGITGAKAGALNWAADHVDPRAELVAIVDADYHVDPSWLRATVGFFEDPMVGFVQPPHAYRDWQHRRFGRMANWEYTMFFATSMVAMQEHEAGITVGTLSVVRRQALDAAGGWAEWCLTEDSELAIRVHALGYRSVYLREPLGWGLIPDTFASYRNQRRRWTYGPVQELRVHWHRLRPRALGGSPVYSRSQRLHHATHGLDVALVGVRALAWPFAFAAALNMLVQHEHPAVPFALWIATTSLLLSGVAIRWLQFCRVTGANVVGAIGAAIAYQSLSHGIILASLAAMFGRPATWHRTDKFRTARKNFVHALATTKAETMIAVLCIVAATTIIAMHSRGLAMMIAIGLAFQAVNYASAPAVALIASADLPV
jgi:cellulose synthase/poly-beta-1,6-N-acetylglucosamine synthase-like glycosyltransferase